MSLTKYGLNLFICCALGLLSTACGAKEDVVPSKSTTQPSTKSDKPESVSTEKVRAALRSPDEDVSETSLGTLVIRQSNDSTNTPGKIFLNGELIYTARSEEIQPNHRGRPFSLRLISFDTNKKKQPDFQITKMVLEERSWTCQHIVLDFTGPKVWLSKRFPEGFQRGQCFEMTWVRWEKNLAYFYFGADESDWEKGKYRGLTAAYNPKLKAVFEHVDIPPPPRRASLVPRPVHLIEAEKKGL